MERADDVGDLVAGKAPPERRRPGRIEEGSLELLPLLRGVVPKPCRLVREPLDFHEEAVCDLRPAEGMLYSALLGLLLWAVIVLTALKLM